jgi:hypothetical protein
VVIISKCIYCNNVSTRSPFFEKEGRVVNVCDWHYKEIKPSALVNLKGYGKCVLCNTVAKRPIKHHVNYFPEQLILVCVSCHNRIHKGDLGFYCPPIDDKKLFYS